MREANRALCVSMHELAFQERSGRTNPRGSRRGWRKSKRVGPGFLNESSDLFRKGGEQPGETQFDRDDVRGDVDARVDALPHGGDMHVRVIARPCDGRVSDFVGKAASQSVEPRFDAMARFLGA